MVVRKGVARGRIEVMVGDMMVSDWWVLRWG